MSQRQFYHLQKTKHAKLGRTLIALRLWTRGSYKYYKSTFYIYVPLWFGPTAFGSHQHHHIQSHSVIPPHPTWKTTAWKLKVSVNSYIATDIKHFNSEINPLSGTLHPTFSFYFVLHHMILFIKERVLPPNGLITVLHNNLLQILE